MLSKSAFNALLKTLEEPPAHVLFILATTEIEKLPITVRSRCQRFDLRRLGVDEVSTYLESLLGKEGIQTEVAALHAIARSADGSVRDALSLTERVLAYSGKQIKAEDVQHALGLVGPEVARSLADAVFSGDAGQSVAQLRSALNAGHAPRTLLLSLSELIHQLSCLKVADTLLADEPDAHERDWLAVWAGRWDARNLDLRYQVLVHGLRDLAMVDEQRGAEMILMRLSYLNDLSAPSDLEALAGRPEKLSAAPVLQAGPESVSEAAADDAPPEVAPDEAHDEAHNEPDLPLHEEGESPGRHFTKWEEALNAYHEIKPGVTAMLEHVGLLEFGDRVRLSLDRHQQNAIAMPDRLAFQEWIGREVFWEAADDNQAESLSQLRDKQAESEKRRLWEQAENDPHVKLMVERLDVRLTDVRAPGVEHSDQ